MADNVPNLPKPTRGDGAAAGLGFAIDVILFPLGLPPGTTASVFAVGAVGAKNAAHTAWEFWSQSKKAQKSDEEQDAQLTNRRYAIRKYFVEQAATDHLKQFDLGSELFEAGALDEDDFRRSIRKILDDYRLSRQ